MTTRTSLPNDIARCNGGELPHCSHCARHLLQPNDSYWAPFFSAPPLEEGKKDCAWFIDIEMDDN